MTDVRILHITDPHITGKGVPLKRDDHKTTIPAINHATRESVLKLTLDRLCETLQRDGASLDAIVFSGDATLYGETGGQQALLDMLLTSLAPIGITAEKIVATPGNHDVPKGTGPGSDERYQAFLDVWRKAGCVTPWLDGIDPAPVAAADKHRLVDPSGRWAIYPLNSANWSHVESTLDPVLKDYLDEQKAALRNDGSDKAAKILAGLEKLNQFDMARVSDDQLEALRQIVDTTPRPTSGKQVRILTLHHHLAAPSHREEVKAFADFTNLQLLRTTLREREIDVVLHGHKHEHVARFDYIYGETGKDADVPRRTLVLSGATFGDQQDKDAARLITLKGLPFAPALETTPIPILRSGTSLKLGASKRFQLWPAEESGGATFVLTGTDLDTLYHQACSVAALDAKDGTLIVELDLGSEEEIRLPTGYPLPDGMTPDERDKWFRELVDWWQLKRSNLDARIPYLHGIRLNRFAGNIDQIERVKKMVARKGSSRILATLIDPARDFSADGTDEKFASFCLVQFRRKDEATTSAVDVIGYYRAQEFARWWPINVAELRALQKMVLKGTKLKAGRITTITAEARTIGRSPTQVAMPVIDRWLDQHPERLHVLANLFTGTRAEPALEQLLIRAWMQTLDDLEAAAAFYNDDGVPVPIDGLETLAAYLEANDPKAEAKVLLSKLHALIKANRIYASSAQNEQNFKDWAARDLVPELRVLSIALL